jgi:HNH endonuclease
VTRQSFVDYPLIMRLSENVSIDGECLVWTGATAQGYGRLHRNGGSQLVHRLAYELVNGAIPDGYTLDHLCRNRACFNPDHLEPVTRGENVRRGHPYRQRKEVCINGHSLTGENVRIVHSRGRKPYPICVECRRRAGREWGRRNYQSRKDAS